jgi:pimeloyl-ACP methyl ester carboxylesterase
VDGGGDGGPVTRSSPASEADRGGRSFRAARIGWPILLLLAPLAVRAQQADTIVPRPRESGYAELRGRRMYYELYGAGRPLLMLHGGGGSIQNFARQLPYFARDRLVIAPEQMGQGHTPDADRPLSYADMAENTAELLQRLQVKDADVLGWSDGGILGLMLAIRHPSLVRRLAISGANVRPGREAITPAMLAELRAYDPTADTAGRNRYAGVSPDSAGHYPVIIRKLLALWLDHPTPTELTLGELRRIRVPTLVIAGDRDVIRLEETIAIYRAIPGAELFIVPATGHATLRERPELLNPILWGFFEGKLRPPDRSQ